MSFQKLVSSIVCLSGLFVFCSPVSATSLQSSAAQVAAFQALSDDEKKALAAQLGVDLPIEGANVQNDTVHLKNVSSLLQRSIDVSKDQSLPSNAGMAEAEGIVDSTDLFEQAKNLAPFGYDLFAGQPTTFEPLYDVPVSSDYILGTGDSLKVNLFGKESRGFDLSIGAEGKAYLPELGPLHLSGLPLSDARQKIIDTYAKKVIGVRASVSMGSLRSIRVFVLGEAYLPGSYVVSSLSTITNVLLLSGGVAETGSLRNIQLKRRGEVVQTLDLYDLLLAGDTSGDAQLRSGDVVFIPPLANTVSVAGRVLRPAVYETLLGDTSESVITYAGGLLPNALVSEAKIMRVDQNDNKRLVELPSIGAGVEMKPGDVLVIPAKLNSLKHSVRIGGYLKRPGPKKWSQGMRISDVFSNLDLLEEGADLNYAILKRVEPRTREVKLLTFSPKKIKSASFHSADLELRDQDELIFLSGSSTERRFQIDELLDELKAQASNKSPYRYVVANGSVRYPGEYPLTPDMTLAELIAAAGGLSESAYDLAAELYRVRFDEGKNKVEQRSSIDLFDLTSSVRKLENRDSILVRQIPEFAEKVEITLQGEVRFPGTYLVKQGESLIDVVERAGGLTKNAYLKGAIYTREELKRQEELRLAQLQDRLTEDIAKAEISVSQNDQKAPDLSELDRAQSLLKQLKLARAQGRLVLDLEVMFSETEPSKLTIQHEDQLFIPPLKNSVTVIGEVQVPVSQLYQAGKTVDSYIADSGGYSKDADENRVYVIKANGAIAMPNESNWFANQKSIVEPGDTIVVPLDAKKVDSIVLWKDVTQILYQTALGVVAVGTL